MSKFKSLPILAGAAALMLGFGLATPRSAHATTFDLSTDLCSNPGCGTAPFGTVDVTSPMSGELDFVVTLAANEVFAMTGAGGDTAFLFNITGFTGTPT